MSPSLHGNFAHASLLGRRSVFFGAGAVETGSTQFRQTGQLIPGDYTLRVEEATLLAFALNSRIRTTKGWGS
ncbi:MAG TPA: hypothetical protein VJV97_06150 [Gemmatimonadaceae bacterium]|nr:hypothetical protein [Gemmatimonadaceae bacterium]